MRRRTRRWPWQPFRPYELGRPGLRLGLAPELRFGTMVCPWLSRTAGDLILRPSGGFGYAFERFQAGLLTVQIAMNDLMSPVLKAIAAFDLFGQAVKGTKIRGIRTDQT